MTDTTEKLLPCAHCGAELPFMQNYQGLYQIQCRTCDIETRFQPKKYAIAAWNLRVAEKPKWTKEPPTEEGCYLMLTKVRTTDFYGKAIPSVVLVLMHKGVLKFQAFRTLNGWKTIDEFCDFHAPILGWQKIHIPAVPEEGEAT